MSYAIARITITFKAPTWHLRIVVGERVWEEEGFLLRLLDRIREITDCDEFADCLMEAEERLEVEDEG